MKRRRSGEVEFDELDDETKEERFIYFHKLPIGGVLKIGISHIANGNYHRRVTEAQRYFAEDVVCLGIVLCGDEAKAKDFENQLKRSFSVARPNSELIADAPKVRDYIQRHCDADVGFIAQMSHIAELRRNRNRSA